MYNMHSLFIELPADGLIVVIVLVGVWALLTNVPSPKLQAYSRIIMAGLTALLLAKFIAVLYQPEALRPFEQLGKSAGAAYLNNPGFPSDHTLLCMAITLAVWFETRMKKLAGALFVLTLLVAIGRVLALVHTPLDVIGGVLIACAGIPWYLQRPKNDRTSDSRTLHKKRVK